MVFESVFNTFSFDKRGLLSNKGIQIQTTYFEKKKNNCFGDTPYFSLLLIILFLIHKVSLIAE